jgi:hypothetical protein
MSTPSPAQEQVVLDYAAIWSESDPARQSDLIHRTLTDDARILGPGFELTGHAAILAEAQRFAKDTPGVRAVMASGIDAHHNTARFAIAMVMPDGRIAHRGEDILLFAPDARIELVLTYWSALPPIPPNYPERVTLRADDGT